MKKADFDRRRFLKNSAKLVAGATAAASIPEKLVTARSDDYTAVNHLLEQSDNCESDFEFNNWDHTLHCEPKLYCEPRSEGEVVDLVKQTYARGGVVRAFGAGHSWSPLVPTSDTLISLRKLKTPVTVDTGQMRATVPAGMRIKDVIKVLRGNKNGLGMQNLGSITRQRIAGAISTGTHGTGKDIGNLSTQIIAMKLIDGLGKVHELSKQDPEFAAARISLGALGIISQVTIQCVKDYNLLYKSEHRPFKELQHTLDYDLNNNERLRLYWFSWIPDDIQVMTMNPTTAAATKESGPAENPTVQAVAPDTYSLPYWQGLGLKVESNKRKGSKARLTWFNEEKVKPYDQALTTIMPPPHQESEYAIPIEKAAEAVQKLKRLIKDQRYLDLILVEVRFVAQDDIMLSPSHDRPVCYVGGYIFGKLKADDFFKDYEQLMKSLVGRPHWGKHLTLSQQEARGLYPKTFDRFNDIRKKLDPKGIFANDFIHNLFG
jgi:L-gulonolactone oxidase